MDEFVAFSTGNFPLLPSKCPHSAQYIICLPLDESFLSNNSSLSTGDRNGDAIYLRFSEMEKKIADQADEIVCLKSTLADVLRRLSQLEGRGNVQPTVFY